MCHKGQHHVCPLPLGFIFQTGGSEDREIVNDAAEALAQEESLQVGHDGLPLVIVGVGQVLQRQTIREEAIFG